MLRLMTGWSVMMLGVSAAVAQEATPPGQHVPATPKRDENESPASFFFSRSELRSQIGRSTQDKFELFEVADNNGEIIDAVTLDENTIADGQGPGLVHDGATYIAEGTFAWCGAGFEGVPTRSIFAIKGAAVTILYDAPTQIFGVDLYTLDDVGHDSVTVRVFDRSGADVGSTVMSIPADHSPHFVGFRNDNGIGGVDIIGQARTVSPVLDDHEYGLVCGESDPCNGSELLTVNVRARGCGCQVQAIIKHGTPGATYGFIMPDEGCMTAEANRKGKAKVKQCPSPSGRVLVPSCGLEGRARCP